MWILSKCESDFMNKGIVQMKNFDLEPTYENIKKHLRIILLVVMKNYIIFLAY